jgi:ketosteroid isomerase-like protein
MASANVEIVLAFLDAYSRGAFEHAVSEFCAPDVEGYPDVFFPVPRPRVGRAELKAFFNEIGSPWADPARYVVTEVVPVGDRVVTRGDWIGRGAASGIESRSEWSIVFTVNDRQITRIAWLSDHSEALKLVGIGGHDPDEGSG